MTYDEMRDILLGKKGPDVIGEFAPKIAKWVREFDPEFVSISDVYIDDDEALTHDWLCLIEDDDGFALKMLDALIKFMLKDEANAG